MLYHRTRVKTKTTLPVDESRETKNVKNSDGPPRLVGKITCTGELKPALRMPNLNHLPSGRVAKTLGVGRTLCMRDANLACGDLDPYYVAVVAKSIRHRYRPKRVVRIWTDASVSADDRRQDAVLNISIFLFYFEVRYPEINARADVDFRTF